MKKQYSGSLVRYDNNDRTISLTGLLEEINKTLLELKLNINSTN